MQTGTEFDILVTLGILEADKAREFWSIAAVCMVALCSAILLVSFLSRFKGPIAKAVAFLAHPKNALVTACFLAALIYGSTKSDIVVPQKHEADFQQTTADAKVSGQVEYWKAPGTTNDIDVALFDGAVTSKFDFADGQFIYAYDASIGVSSPQQPGDNRLWVRASDSSNWISSVTASWTMTNTHYAAVIATLPENESPAKYKLWFIGCESNLPPVVVEVTGGIDIVRAVITSSDVTIQFKGTDVRFSQGSHVYYLQMRERGVDGILTDWVNVASVTLPDGVTEGTVGFTGYTVGNYREYRVYSDLELAQ